MDKEDLLQNAKDWQNSSPNEAYGELLLSFKFQLHKRFSRRISDGFAFQDLENAIMDAIIDVLKFDPHKFEISKDLYNFLTTITEYKISDILRMRLADKRDINRETSLFYGDKLKFFLQDSALSPDEIASMREEISKLYSCASDDQKKVLDGLMLGETNEEISERSGFHLRKVQRVLKSFRERQDVQKIASAREL